MLPARQLKKATAIALALSAAVPAAAAAKPIGPDPAGASYPPLTTPIVRITIPTSGFDWGDAGIGAAGGLALSMLGVGGALVLTQRRSRHPHRPATPTS
jgi:hypothetical protein